MNILMALSQLEVTGAEVYATTVGNELTARGHNVFYVSDTLTKPHKGPFFSLRFNKRSVPRRFWHVGYLIYLIKKHNIQLVHAHSRASSWSCHVACKLTGTPMVTTVHGRQPVHASRKKFHAMGDKALPVCEAIRDQLHSDLDVPLEQMEVSRNGIETDQFQWVAAPDNSKPVITIVGRLTGPKGDLCYRLLDECLDSDKYDIRVVTGSKFESRFEKFTSTVNFVGYTNDVPKMLSEADLVIGAGRVAMESLLCGRPTLAIGEAKCIGIVDDSNVSEAMASNFGDIGPKDLDIDFSGIASMVESGLNSAHCNESTSQTIRDHYALANIVDQVECIYQDVYIDTLRREMPVIMYHRFIKDDSGKGVHGTYLHIDMFDKHMALLKKMGFETLTFEDLQDGRLIRRLDAGKRYIMITVDDGYVDNLELMLPVLEKYGFKAVVYVVTGESFNRWDVENPDNPEKSVPLMNADQVRLLSQSELIEIGGHTLSHPKLNTLSDAQQRHEIIENKAALEATIGKPLTSFAYPFGEHNQASKDIAKEVGYQYAVATNSGPLQFHKDPYQIRRIAIFPKTDVFGLWRKVRGNYLFRKAKK
ncbi:polysaccharide deacetylase family protein [Vibrio hangzhouensis]|uniref:Peptidoglycan/xylan/chitin deacetylase, PgdA/CDA1 family n=1 Tax=Vibrio hangzhouensis TaxID=462991 RepID=A0A1H6CCJ7_9VIBR|nr:polysaccharide deacetylase family protein [Vibrio hangzhouensis]SEG70096.1 Peptidoglycan/xylan/chitin deacetylase, PgdA/CDA1 family [Vibrio hangzhouensis]